MTPASREGSKPVRRALMKPAMNDSEKVQVGTWPRSRKNGAVGEDGSGGHCCTHTTDTGHEGTLLHTHQTQT